MPKRYSDETLPCGLVIRAVLALPWRATEGLSPSVLALLGVEFATPDYRTFRHKSLRRTLNSPGFTPTQEM